MRQENSIWSLSVGCSCKDDGVKTTPNDSSLVDERMRQTEPFRPFGTHQCSADEFQEQTRLLMSRVRRLTNCGTPKLLTICQSAIYIYAKLASLVVVWAHACAESTTTRDASFAILIANENPLKPTSSAQSAPQHRRSVIRNYVYHLHTCHVSPFTSHQCSFVHV
jgi:hypothetical protein